MTGQEGTVDNTMSKYPKPTNPKASPAVDPCSDKLPKRLSPSRAKDFVQCPRLFFEKSVAKSITWENTAATTKGTLVHYALEKLFDHPREERTADTAATYIRPKWATLAKRNDYAKLASQDEAAVETMLVDAEEMVREYFLIEDPTKFDPIGREQWVKGQIGSVPLNGVIDRFDSWTSASTGEQMHAISDYKTGKLPGDAYVDEAFFAMRVYAAGIRETKGVTVDVVRLIHTRHGKEGVLRMSINDAVIDETIAEYEQIWSDIQSAASAGKFPCKTSVLCNWCDAQTTTCPAWQDKDGQPVDLNSRL